MSLARRTIELRIIFSLLKEAEKFLQREREREKRVFTSVASNLVVCWAWSFTGWFDS